MKINKFDTSKLPDNFKKQICDRTNKLVDHIEILEKEIENLKKSLRSGKN